MNKDIADYSIAMFSLSNTGYTSGVGSFNGIVFSSLDFGIPNENISGIFVMGLDQSRVSLTSIKTGFTIIATLNGMLRNSRYIKSRLSCHVPPPCGLSFVRDKIIN